MFQFQSIFKLSIFLVFTGGLVNQAYAQNQQWECAVNLQQGDTGVMSLSRKGSQVEGAMTTVRNSTDFNSEIKGSWNNNEINLTRLTGANSNEPMAGIVVTLGSKKVKMGGRFSTEYHGVWSADCVLVSTASSVGPSNTSGSSQSATAEDVAAAPPSLTSRVSPSEPTSNKQITLSARASHPQGIESIDFFVNGKKAHTCDTDSCSYKHGSLKTGRHTWYAQATSKSGTKSAKQANQLVVSSAKAATCTVSGTATGPSANLSLSYRVILEALNDESRFRVSTEFDGLRYRISGIPKGEYAISVDTLADSSVLWSPTTAIVKCDSQKDLQQNFDFR